MSPLQYITLLKCISAGPEQGFFHCPRQVQNCCIDKKGHHCYCCWQSELFLCRGLLPSSRGGKKAARGQILAAPSSLNKDANLWPVTVEGEYAPLSAVSATKQLCWVAGWCRKLEAMNPTRAGKVDSELGWWKQGHLLCLASATGAIISSRGWSE